MNPSNGTTINIPPTINEGSDGDTVSVLSTTQPTNLTNNQAYQADQQSTNPTTQSMASGASTTSFHTAADSQPSEESNDAAFARVFGGPGVLDQLHVLERDRANILQPILEKEYAAVNCSAISRHMWVHAEHMNFTTKKELYAWIRSNWEISIVPRTNVITNNKTAGTKECSLCMQERVQIFHAFREKKNNLMNSRDEFSLLVHAGRC